MDKFIKNKIEAERIAEVEYQNGREAGVRQLQKALLEAYDGIDTETLRLIVSRLIADITKADKYSL